MDHIDEYLATACQNMALSEAIRAALALGKKTLNRYYDKTDHSEVYRIAMGKSIHVPFYVFPSSLFLKFSTLVINYIISGKLDGRKPGSRPHATLSVPNLIKLMHLWTSMLKPHHLSLMALILWYIFFLIHSGPFPVLDADFPSALVI
jgi:hypothetical protein